MKYFFIILIFFLLGCENKKENKNLNFTKEIKIEQQQNKPIIIQIEDLNFTKKDNKITYNFKKQTILFFKNNNKDSKLELAELNSLNKKFYTIKNPELIEFFKIKQYPTILIIDKNKTKRFEGFIPAIMLKYELKD